MPVTENQSSFLNRISIRRNQIASLDSGSNDQDQEDFDAFIKHVSDRFSALLPPVDSSPSAVVHEPPPLLTIPWFHDLLDSFLSCESQFKAALLLSGQLSRPPPDRLVLDFLDRSVKALDVLNAVTNGFDLVHHWLSLAHIAVAALRSGVGDGPIRRARRALAALLASMSFDDKDSAASGGGGVSNHKWTERTRSFGRRIGDALTNRDRAAAGNPRSLSWSVARSWSAARQVSAMLNSLAPPRGGEGAGGGLSVPIYIMNTVVVFVVWALVAAVPCQERHGLAATHFQMPRGASWAAPMTVLQERIGEEWKRRRGSPGLLEELQRMEAVAHSLVEFADAYVFPVEDEKAAELTAQVEELSEICRRMEEGLGPLQQQVRDVFHRIVKSRGEVLDVLDQLSKLSAAVQY